jgi:hypothetical protein
MTKLIVAAAKNARLKEIPHHRAQEFPVWWRFLIAYLV